MNKKTINKIFLAIILFSVFSAIITGAAIGMNAFSKSRNLPGVTPTTTSPSIVGSQVFMSYCAQCHASDSIRTKLTGEQLLTFIPNHNTGSILTPDQVAAVASFLRP